MSENEEATTPAEPADAGEPDAAPAKPGKPRGRVRRYGPFGVLVGFVVLVAVAGLWLVHLGHDAQNQLSAVRADITRLRADVTANDTAAVTGDEKDLADHAHRARRDTRDVIWRAVAKVPDVGVDLKVAGGLADVADNLATRVLPPLSDATISLRPDAIRNPADGSIDLTKLTSAQKTIAAALPVLDTAEKRVAGLQQRVHLGQLETARTEFDKQLQDVSTSLTTANQALTLLPPMLGADGPRNYLLVFQNLAEARGTGGLLGAYGVLHADHGVLTLPTSGSDGDLEGAKNLMNDPVDLGPDFEDRWSDYGVFRDWFVANLTPDWPSASRIFAAHYDQQLGGTIDGVIGIDPYTLSALLGPDSVTLSNGDVVSGADVPTYTMQTLYNKYGEDNPIRKQLLVELAKSAFNELTHAPGARLLTAVETSAAAGRLDIWSSHAPEQSVLVDTPIGSALPTYSGSFAWLLVANEGPKTDFSLDRSLTYTAGACPTDGSDQRDSTIEAKLTDNVPPGQNKIISDDTVDPGSPYGQGRSLVSIYAAAGASLQSATLNGAPIVLQQATEAGHTVYSYEALLTPVGAPEDFVLHLSEPVSSHSYVWRAQPLARPETVSDTVTPCDSDVS